MLSIGIVAGYGQYLEYSMSDSENTQKYGTVTDTLNIAVVLYLAVSKSWL